MLRMNDEVDESSYRASPGYVKKIKIKPARLMGLRWDEDQRIQPPETESKWLAAGHPIRVC
jgi:hypothetical protein